MWRGGKGKGVWNGLEKEGERGEKFEGGGWGVGVKERWLFEWEEGVGVVRL